MTVMYLFCLNPSCLLISKRTGWSLSVSSFCFLKKRIVHKYPHKHGKSPFFSNNPHSDILISKKPQLLPACERYIESGYLYECLVWLRHCDCSTVVGAAVVHKQLSDLKRKAVLGCLDRRVEATHSFLVFFDEKLYLSSVVVLSVPKHGVAAHVKPFTHSALQRHRGSWGRRLISRLKDYNRESCSTWRSMFQCVSSQHKQMQSNSDMKYLMGSQASKSCLARMFIMS